MSNETGIDQAALAAREELERTRQAYFAATGSISEAQLYRTANKYIAALSAYQKRTGKKFRLPTPAQLLR